MTEIKYEYNGIEYDPFANNNRNIEELGNIYKNEISIFKQICPNAWRICKGIFSYEEDLLIDKKIFTKLYIDLDTIDNTKLQETNECVNQWFYDHKPNVLINPTKEYLKKISANGQKFKVLVGCPGVGKSAFLRHLTQVVCPSKIDNFLCVKIDLNASIKDVHLVQKNAFAEIHDQLDKFNNTLTSNDNLASRLLESCKHYNTVLVVDNIDNRDYPQNETETFRVFLNLYNSLKTRLENENNCSMFNITFIVPMRRLTYSTFSESGNLFDRNIASIDLLSAPPLDEILNKRIEFLLEVFSKNDKSDEDSDGVHIIKYKDKTVNIKCLTRDEQFRLICEAFKSISHSSYFYIGSITLGNIRASIRIFIKYIFSPAFNHSGFGNYLHEIFNPNSKNNISINPFPTHPHDIARHIYRNTNLQLRKYDFLSKENLFDCNRINWQNYLIKTRVIQYLSIKTNRNFDDSMTIEDLIRIFVSIGYDKKIIITALRSLVKNRIAITPTLKHHRIYAGSKEKIHIGTLGRYALKGLIPEIGYMEACLFSIPIDINPNEINKLYNRPYSFLFTAKLLCNLAICEKTEEEVCTHKGQRAQETLQRIKGKSQLWRTIQIEHKDTLKKIIKTKNDKFKKGVYKALQEYNHIDKQLDNISIKIFTSSNINYSELADNIVTSCIDSENGFYNYPKRTGRTWWVQAINQVQENSQHSFGVEAFIEFNGIKGGCFFNALSNDHPQAIANFDSVAIKTITHSFSEILDSYSIGLISINISSEFLSKTFPKNFQPIIQRIADHKNVVLELPDSLKVNKISMKNLEYVFDTLGKKKQIAIDDIGGLGANTLHYCPEQEYQNFRFFKIDYKFFQALYKYNKNRLKEILLHNYDLFCKKHSSNMVIEGIETNSHLTFIQETLPTETGRILAQGFHINPL